MSLTPDDVRHVAQLARLALTDDQLDVMSEQLGAILAYAEQVAEVATADVPATGHPLRLANVWRDDEPRPSLSPHEALAPAPAAENGRFRVPRIIGEQPGARPREEPAHG
ncbi:MAG: Asp-tRNA(Asn)/Glu-tRNA(Gln) amidotransferase subunit GatC [Egibacteraceae bacterium]